jgi:hypothetical protein
MLPLVGKIDTRAWLVKNNLRLLKKQVGER